MRTSCKHIELKFRDELVQVLATRVGPSDYREIELLKNAGYGQNIEEQEKTVFLMRLTPPFDAQIAPGNWITDPDMRAAHEYIIRNYVNLRNGTMVEIIQEQSEKIIDRGPVKLTNVEILRTLGYDTDAD